MRIRLSLQQLDAITRLARLGSFRDTAIEIGMSQPGLSRVVQAVEARLNARIFDRDTHRLALTAAGEFLIPQAESLLAQYDQTFTSFEDFLAGDTGVVRIATLPSVAAVLLPPVLAHFAASSPKLRLEVIEAIGDPVARAVKDSTAEIGITAPVQDEDLHYTELLKEEVVLVCRYDDPLAGEQQHGWDVFAGRPFVALSTDTVLRSMADQAFASNGLAIASSFSCRQPSTACALVAAGMGITALPWLAARQFASGDLVYRRLIEPVSTRSIGLLTHSRRSLSPSARLIVRSLRTAARQLASDGQEAVRAR